MALFAGTERRGYRPRPALGTHHGEECAEASESRIFDQIMRPSRDLHAQTPSVSRAQARERDESISDTGDRGRSGTTDRRMVEIGAQPMNP